MVEIIDYDHKGNGIAKLNNKVIFVKNAMPGEIVDLKIINEEKKYIQAEVNSYIKKSDKRIKPKCPYYDICGGCNIMHLSYDEQLKYKQEKINNIVRKYLNQYINVNDIVKCDYDTNYRNKATFKVNKKIGYYKENTYELVKIDTCLLVKDKINNSIKYLNKLDLSKIDEIVCRSTNNKLMIIISTNDKELNIDCIKDICDSIYFKINNKYIHIYKDKYIDEILGKYKYIISPDSFFQVNTNTCIKLYNKIKNNVGKNNNILDLYCGTGSISIYVSENNNVTGIEINESAIKDANINKEINNIKNINFICKDSGKYLNNNKNNIDIIIVDPPRNGLNKETINNIIKTNVKKIIYVSCDPMTLVRDLKILSDYYNIIEITPFDMFPNTYHVETFCVLGRK